MFKTTFIINTFCKQSSPLNNYIFIKGGNIPVVFRPKIHPDNTQAQYLPDKQWFTCRLWKTFILFVSIVHFVVVILLFKDTITLTQNVD